MKRCSVILVVAFVTLLSGCAPRGETKTLDQVLSDAHSQFVAIDKKVAQSSSRPSEVGKAVADSVQAVESLIATASVADTAKHARFMEQQLEMLTMKAGYTSRPSLTELKKQYAVMADNLEADQQKGKDTAAVKLLAARTYNALASELETTNFSL